MATVHLGRLRALGGFSRTVAIKRLHAQYARDPEFVAMFLDEARLAARVHHPNVVHVLDVLAFERELFLVMEYVHGEPLGSLIIKASESGTNIPPRIVAQIMMNVLQGLHAAHEARSERGVPLEIVHRDVSPQNVLVGSDGVARVLDFGVAHASEHLHKTTETGKVKGKIAYMAPEQLTLGSPDRRADVYSASVLLWEALTGRRLFGQADIGMIVTQIMGGTLDPPSKHAPAVTPELDEVVMKGLARDRRQRFQTAQEMALALERAVFPALQREVSEWVTSIAAISLSERAAAIAQAERDIASVDGIDALPLLPRSPSPSFAHVLRAAGATPAPPPVEAPPEDEAPSRPPAPRVARSRIAFLLVVTVGLVAVGLLVNRRGPHPRSTPDDVASSLGAPPAANASASATVTATSATAPSLEPSAPPPESTASPPSTAARHGQHSAPAPAKPRVPPRLAGTNDCDPPWTLDAQGTRILKRQCL